MNKRQAASKSTVEILVVCPFCGHKPTVEPWHGGGPNKHAVGCDNRRCHATPMVVGNTKAVAIRRWNKRTPNATHDGRRIRRTVDGIVGNLNGGE